VLSEKGLGTRGGNEKEGTETFTSTYRICAPFSTVVDESQSLFADLLSSPYTPLTPTTDLVGAVFTRHLIRSALFPVNKLFKLLYSTSRTELCCTKEQLVVRGAIRGIVDVLGQGPVAGIEIYADFPAEVELILFRGGD
jgi:hypothetical protein